MKNIFKFLAVMFSSSAFMSIAQADQCPSVVQNANGTYQVTFPSNYEIDPTFIPLSKNLVQKGNVVSTTDKNPLIFSEFDVYESEVSCVYTHYIPGKTYTGAVALDIIPTPIIYPYLAGCSFQLGTGYVCNNNQHPAPITWEVESQEARCISSNEQPIDASNCQFNVPIIIN